MTWTKPENLYHAISTISHLRRDPTSEIERVYIPGPYISLVQAKAAVQSCLFDSGYEREWSSMRPSRRKWKALLYGAFCNRNVAIWNTAIPNPDHGTNIILSN